MHIILLHQILSPLVSLILLPYYSLLSLSLFLSLTSQLTENRVAVEKMKDEEAQTTTTKTTWKKEYTVQSQMGKHRYKLWALAAILLLAFWSMLTGSVTLKWSSSGNLNPLSNDFDSPIPDDLDTLELEEREKLVKHMWDVYTHSSSIRLPRFWLEAFQVAYEDLTTDVPSVRNAAFSEIAKMSFSSAAITVQSPPLRSKIDDNQKKKKHVQAS
ncbi:hypothetical protein ACSBR2_029088 [Camellia fascicularis]